MKIYVLYSEDRYRDRETECMQYVFMCEKEINKVKERKRERERERKIE